MYPHRSNLWFDPIPNFLPPQVLDKGSIVDLWIYAHLECRMKKDPIVRPKNTFV